MEDSLKDYRENVPREQQIRDEQLARRQGLTLEQFLLLAGRIYETKTPPAQSDIINIEFD